MSSYRASKSIRVGLLLRQGSSILWTCQLLRSCLGGLLHSGTSSGFGLFNSTRTAGAALCLLRRTSRLFSFGTFFTARLSGNGKRSQQHGEKQFFHNDTYYTTLSRFQVELYDVF